MKLTDFLQDVGRPIAYYPSLRKITGSTNATILLCQFIYWRGKESDPEGWLYKDAETIEIETGLSYEEQKAARRRLIETNLLEEYYARLEHQMWFRLILDTINEKWASWQCHAPEQGNATFGKKALPCSLIESETTTETTTDNLPAQEEPESDTPIVPAKPVGIDISGWAMKPAMDTLKRKAETLGVQAIIEDEKEDPEYVTDEELFVSSGTAARVKCDTDRQHRALVACKTPKKMFPNEATFRRFSQIEARSYSIARNEPPKKYPIEWIDSMIAWAKEKNKTRTIITISKLLVAMTNEERLEDFKAKFNTKTARSVKARSEYGDDKIREVSNDRSETFTIRD